MVLCINPIVTDHFKVSVRDMYNQAFDKVNGGDAFGYSFMVFMALIVEGHRSPIIGINPGSGNDGPAQISADIFNQKEGLIPRSLLRNKLFQDMEEVIY